MGRSASSVAAVALDRVRHLVRDYVYVPDALVPWIPFAVAGARRALRTASGEAVLLSTSVPTAPISRRSQWRDRSGCPWVAELRDPWTLIDDRIRHRPRVRKAIDVALERRVVAAASAVVVTSDLTREAMVRVHPELCPRARVVRNGFEPSAGPAPGRRRSGWPRYSSFTRDRCDPRFRSEPLLRGVDRVAKEPTGRSPLAVVGPPEPWRSAAERLPGAGTG